MHALGVKVERGRTSSELFMADGHCFKSGAGILNDCKGRREQLKEIWKVLPILGGYFSFLRTSRHLKSANSTTNRCRSI